MGNLYGYLWAYLVSKAFLGGLFTRAFHIFLQYEKYKSSFGVIPDKAFQIDQQKAVILCKDTFLNKSYLMRKVFIL